MFTLSVMQYQRRLQIYRAKNIGSPSSTPHLPGYGVQNEPFNLATCSLPMTSICSEAVKKNCNNSLEDRRKPRMNTVWKSAPKISSQDKHQHTDERQTLARRSGSVQILTLRTKQRPKEVKIRLAQTHSAMTLCKKESHMFSHKDYTYRTLFCRCCSMGATGWRLHAFEVKCYD